MAEAAKNVRIVKMIRDRPGDVVRFRSREKKPKLVTQSSQFPFTFPRGAAERRRSGRPGRVGGGGRRWPAPASGSSDLAQQYSAELSPALFGCGDCFLIYVQRNFINSSIRQSCAD
uniref:Uncharacterized protein n=1 Tax=Oryza punctata TaxID=4537 RepID=A0A0E0JJJ8_ORYPU